MPIQGDSNGPGSNQFTKSMHSGIEQMMNIGMTSQRSENPSNFAAHRGHAANAPDNAPSMMSVLDKELPSVIEENNRQSSGLEALRKR